MTTVLSANASDRHRLTPRSDPTEHLVTRGLVVVGLVGITLVHLVQLPDTFRETAALGWCFTALSATAALLAVGLVPADRHPLWYLAGLTALGAIAGYVLTRSVSLPFDHDDVGNWLEPLGLVALFVEASVAGLCGYRLLARPRS